MLVVLAGILVLAALASWAVALMSAIGIVGIVPAGQRWRAWFALGGWRMGELRGLGGPAVELLLKRYQLAFLAFFAVVVCCAGLGILLGAEYQKDQPEAAVEVVQGG